MSMMKFERNYVYFGSGETQDPNSIFRLVLFSSL